MTQLNNTALCAFLRVTQHTWLFVPQVGFLPPLYWALRLCSPQLHWLILVIPLVK